MDKKALYINTIALIMLSVSIQALAQQPAVYEVKRMPFNINGFDNISPVIVNDGVIFCSDRTVQRI